VLEVDKTACSVQFFYCFWELLCICRATSTRAVYKRMGCS